VAGKLGALPRDLTKFMPRLENYITGPIRVTGLPPASGDIDRCSEVTSWPMYLNGPDPANAQCCPGSPDGIGDCTCAAFGHMIQSWTQYAGTGQVTVPPTSIVKAYVAVTGMEGAAYDPQTGENDNGCDPGDVLSYMKNTGMADSTGKVHKVAGYAALGDPTDEELLAQVLNTFGNVYVAINFPDSAMSQFDDGEPWSVVQGSPIDGGHMIDLQRRAVGGTGVLKYVTWGQPQPTTRGFQKAYATDAFAVVSNDWITANGTSVEGLNLTQLLSDMQYVA
jgi:hypothetical protein